MKSTHQSPWDTWTGSHRSEYWRGVLSGFVLFAVVWTLIVPALRSPRQNAKPSVNSVTNTEAPIAAATISTSPISSDLSERVLPSNGVTLPITWGDMGAKMIASGVIDQEKFESLYAARGGMTPEMSALLTGSNNGALTITRENSGFLLNLLWGLGIGNENTILTEGPMNSEAFGNDPSRFASTGGWSLSVGNPMDHYSAHRFVTLTPEQQELVERVAKGIYRPCCGNSTLFPDCNHGMAMLGLLELMASQGLSEQEMYDAALSVNAYWFQETYLTIATFFESQGTPWETVPAQVALSAEYSSSSGYKQLVQKTAPVQAPSGGGGCGV
ncbi:hypothetical protein A3B32_00740 [Candidatus Uhrbacteria bacterium RIFCSPLOWO2_01_FULL_53_9]|uniref:Uncharacterized protein n=3 Tax=Candidatus Uhriibacteriota TaxID=1752732 RepID=A0A1F7UZ22_9BACT|nr:MAG: hypothetical protein A3C17_00175 [Candidatus Uhrbacteria bacterium RIFCSPHIGHO2_02_FULL_53_13]OGL82967.1 MAG: hypothetical protein A3B32_00740 [Candidatus Uhrbacteria bacterium RIFCSPLOWO2_01_FULL_53_9]